MYHVVEIVGTRIFLTYMCRIPHLLSPAQSDESIHFEIQLFFGRHLESVGHCQLFYAA